ncbi:MAG: hypothetical protein GPJ14_21875 [Microcystis aeruginosa G11-01]|jgi:exonuclease III|nr:hypothetical protein [Microcystis aeruginosa G11-01]
MLIANKPLSLTRHELMGESISSVDQEYVCIDLSKSRVIVFFKPQDCELFDKSSQSNLQFSNGNQETTQNSCKNIFQELEDHLAENRDEVENLVLLGDEDIDIEEYDSIASQQIDEMICEKYSDSAYDIYF